MGQRLLVLGWHNVEGTGCFPSRAGSGSAGLYRQLTALDRLANVVPLEPALADLDAGRPIPRRAVALTFDDGYADVLSIAAPMLERLRLPATFFLVPGLLSREVRAWWEALALAFATATAPRLRWNERSWVLDGAGARRRAFTTVAEQLKELDAASREAAVDVLVALAEPAGAVDRPELFLDWAGAGELVRRGFAIGSHTSAHAILARETPQAQQLDLVTARRRLQEELQVSVDVLAYPNGRARDFDAATTAAAARTGHTHSLTTIEGLHVAGGSPHAVRRCVVYPERGWSELVATVRYAAVRAPAESR